jgi:hypothetical protein
MKAIASKVIWVGRATVFLVGLSVILAVVLGVAETALAGTGAGAPFNLGQKYTVNRLSSLVGSVGSGASLLIANNSTNANATALTLQVERGKAPLRVNSPAKVDRLNADMLDGQDSSSLLVTGDGKQGSFANINGCGSGPVLSYPPTLTRSARIFATASSTYGRSNPGPERPTMKIQLLDGSNTIVAQSGRVTVDAVAGNPSLNISEVLLDTTGNAAYDAPAGNYTLQIFADNFGACTGFGQYQTPRLTHIVLAGGQ